MKQNKKMLSYVKSLVLSGLLLAPIAAGWTQQAPLPVLGTIRAGLVAEAEPWRWSSALAHCHKETDNGLLTMVPWQDHWSEEAWREYLTGGEKESELAVIRRCTYTGRPLGTAEFIRGGRGDR